MRDGGGAGQRGPCRRHRAGPLVGEFSRPGRPSGGARLLVDPDPRRRWSPAGDLRHLFSRAARGEGRGACAHQRDHPDGRAGARTPLVRPPAARQPEQAASPQRYARAPRRRAHRQVARRRRGAVPGAEDGSARPDHRRGRARFQQCVDGGADQPRPCRQAAGRARCAGYEPARQCARGGPARYRADPADARLRAQAAARARSRRCRGDARGHERSAAFLARP